MVVAVSDDRRFDGGDASRIEALMRPDRVVTLEEIELVAVWAEIRGNWVKANWIRSQAQELQVEWERALNA
jgi:hypothetical protein